MEPDNDNLDQQAFDERVNKTGKLALQILAGVAIFAAFMMSLAALVVSGGDNDSGGTAVAATHVRATAPTSAQVMIEHATQGCHNLSVNGGEATSPDATLHLAVGGKMTVQNYDVMPHRLVLKGGPALALSQANMSHMGARTTVTFPAAGVYRFGTKAGEDYMKGVETTGADHVLSIKVVVS